MNRRFRIYGRAARLRVILAYCFKRFEISCHFCGERLTGEDLPARATDSLTNTIWMATGTTTA